MALVHFQLGVHWRDSATALGIVKRDLRLPSEAVAIAKALEPEERGAAKSRRGGDHKGNTGNFPELARTRDQEADFFFQRTVVDSHFARYK